MKNEFSDDVLIIKPYKIEDAETQLENEDEEHWKWLSGGQSTLEGIRKWILENQRLWEEGGPRFAFAVWEKETNQMVGMVETNIDYANLEGLEKDEANISYGIYPRSRGKGNAVRAVKLIGDFLKENGIKRGVIRVEPENIKSVNVALRVGFIKRGSVQTKDNHTLDVYVNELSSGVLITLDRARNV